MQRGIAQDNDRDRVYFGWSTDDWDFGNERHYPALKYAPHPDPDAEAICDAPGMPNCGALLSPALRHGLRALSVVGGKLVLPFGGGDHSSDVEVADGVDGIRLIFCRL